MKKIYNPKKLKDGYNIMDNGEEIFFISNPALGLWSSKERLTDSNQSASWVVKE